MTPVVKLEQVTKIYAMDGAKVTALSDVSLEIKKGEFVAILGPSGSGKSTLMHLIGLLDQPTSGKVFLKGQEISHLSEEEQASLRNKHIGFVFQAFNLLPRTSAVENVEMPLVYSQISKDKREKKAISVLKAVGLSDRLWHFPSQLSGGEKQRVAIARALVNNPTLILADEPTGNLDSKSGREILELLQDLNKKGKTIVLVTHDLNNARRAKRKIELRDGKIVSDK